MAEAAQRALERTVRLLRKAWSQHLLSDVELREIVKKRRTFEYKLVHPEVTRDDYLKYAAFERDLASILRERAEDKKLDPKYMETIIEPSEAIVGKVYLRAVKKFKADEDLWLHYARHCAKSGSARTAGNVFADAIAFRGDSERIWLAAIGFHFDSCDDPRTARALAQRGLRALPDSKTMWKEYFRMEVMYLAKLIARRVSIGLPPYGDSHVPQAENSQNGESQDSQPSLSNGELNGAVEHTPSSSDIKQLGGVCVVGEKLSFWEGGVPIAVFRAAVKAVKLQSEDIADWWNIVIKTPYLPPKFLETFTKELEQLSTNCPAIKVVVTCCPWAVACAKYWRVPLGKKSSGSTEARAEMNERTTLRWSVSKTASDALFLLSKFFGTSLTETEHLKETKSMCLALLDNFKSAMQAIGDFPKVFAQLKKLVKNVSEHTGKKKNKHLTDADSRKDPSNWSLNKFETVLGSEGKSPRLTRAVRTALKKKVLVAFRDLDQENVLCLWLSRETDIVTLREICDTLLSIPPITMKSLLTAVERELNLWRGRREGMADKMEIDKEMVSQVRKLFTKATALTGAKKDVEFWLSYMDFERRVARDSRQASTINWKALKALDNRNKEIFLERQTLRNLAM